MRLRLVVRPSKQTRPITVVYPACTRVQTNTHPKRPLRTTSTMSGLALISEPCLAALLVADQPIPLTCFNKGKKLACTSHDVTKQGIWTLFPHLLSC